MLKAVIFDLDGTLTDSDKVHFQVFQEIFAQKGMVIDEALYRQKISGRQNAALVADFFPDLSAADTAAFSIGKEATFRSLAQGQLTPLPGLMDLLTQIQQRRLAIAVVTNAPNENAVFMLSELGLADTFSPVIMADDLPRGKPDPLPYQTALDHLEIMANEAIAFEDSCTGIRAAVAAGIITIGIMTTHSRSELMAAGATGAIADFTGLTIADLEALMKP
ncbi:MAG: hydrolase [Phormidesmis priestleyi]|uniref:Hydrolase n=1 Tax=Phormidesmis priestleyi TaxID=268141 RepID=A0A2W4WYP5_9CYAN|nr:MAG: hydrolase [Phormidesmis priestleyi]